MARPTNDEKLQTIHAEAIAEFDRVQTALKDERAQCLQDRRFYSIAGAQWEGDLAEQFANRPKYEINKTHLALIRIFNEYRNNRITVDFISKDGTENDELADACDGLFRADEQDSTAEEAYDNAFEEAVGGGFGAWRLRTVYEDEEDPDNDRQRIKIEPIYDADTSVFFDLDAKRQDKADAKRCWVVLSMTPEAFEAEYERSPTSIEKVNDGSEFDWYAPDVVHIAEYYRIEEQVDYALTYIGTTNDEKKMLESELEDEQKVILEATGYKQTRRKRISTKRVHKYLISGNEVLEDMGIIAGKCIPIIPVYGKRWFIDNIERCMGHVRLSKDAQRLLNMQLSKLGEIAALSPVEKPILNPEQVSRWRDMWAEDNIKNWPYLLLDPITGADGNPMPAAAIGYTKPPQVPPANAAILQIVEQALRDILGNQQEADKMVSNISGKAVELIQTRMDMQTFIYVSNFAKAERRCGEVWLSMAKDIYVEEGRTMKTIGATNEIGSLKLMEPVQEKGTKALTTGVDFSRAAFDVAVDVGPSSTSRREATVRALTGLMQMTQDPETVQVLLGMAMMNIEGEGLANVREYFRKKLVQIGVEKPTDEEAQAMAAQAEKPDPNAEALMGMAEEAKAKATKARVDVLKSLSETKKIEADTKKIEAETIETLANVDMASTDQALSIAEKLSPKVQAAPNEGEGVNLG
jgi:hypothetical protein